MSAAKKFAEVFEAVAEAEVAKRNVVRVHTPGRPQ